MEPNAPDAFRGALFSYAGGHVFASARDASVRAQADFMTKNASNIGREIHRIDHAAQEGLGPNINKCRGKLNIISIPPASLIV